MTSPLSPEAVAQMVADREAGTPGPWAMETVRTSCGVCHKIGPWPHKWRAGNSMSACIYDDYPSPPEGTDTMLANARRIASLPDLEAAYLTLAAENATLRAERDAWTKIDVARDVDFATLRASETAALERVKVLEAGLADPVSVHANMLRGAIAMPSFANIKHLYAAEFAALTPTADKEPT